MVAEDARSPVQVDVLGPLRLVVGGESVDVRGPKRRAVLALLALAEGRVVTVDQLVDDLWPEEPPESGRQALHTHVFRLRAHFGVAVDRLQTRHDGYRLDLAGDDLDVTRARALLAQARATSPRDPVRAFELLRSAHALWRGPMLADLTDISAIAAAVQGYERLYRDVTDAMIASAIDAGQAREVLGLATSSHAADPLHEPAVLLLMRALTATAQAPEALRIAREYRHLLIEETGLDPSSALGELERDIASGTAGPTPAPTLTAQSVPKAAPARPAGNPNQLIGREIQVAALHRLLAEHQLVTIVGPGGVGKSRIAAEIARPGPAAVLLLAPVTDAAAIPHALAAALNLTVVQGDVLAACVAVLGDGRSLLVIDNCEHLLDPVRDLVDLLLAECPGLTVLTTSRERLALAAEHVFRLSPLPLPVPDTHEQSGKAKSPELAPSVALFLERSARVRPLVPPTPVELSLISDIVRRLDGMPLAIELAAGRLSSFSLSDLHRRLDRSLDLLGGGRPTADARHRTLRATVEWSYQLLPADERRLFRYLSIFVDGIDLDDAERLATELGLASDPGSILAHLVDASMIEADIDVGTRYRMLETLRAFGLDRLADAGEKDAAAELFLRWAVALAAWLDKTLSTDREPEADAVLRRELPNLRAAWRLARGRGNIDDAAAIVIGLFDAVAYRDLLEIRGWAEELAADPALTGQRLAAGVFGTAAEAAYHRGDYPQAELLARRGLEQAVDAADTRYCLSALSVAALARGAFADAAQHALTAAGLTVHPGENLVVAALAMTYAGDLEEARNLNEKVSAGAVSPTMRAWGSYLEGEIESAAGHPDLAEPAYLDSIALARASGATFLVGVATVGLLTVRVAVGRVREALTGYLDVIDYFDRTGNWTHQWTTLRNLADLLHRLDDHEPAILLEAAADRAPDAPAGARARHHRPLPDSIPGRVEILVIAREAIKRNLIHS